MREGKELAWETLVVQGHVGMPLGLCACVTQPPATCVLGSSALPTGRCASGAVGMTVTLLGISTGHLGSQRGTKVAPKRVPVMDRSTLDVRSRGKQVPEGLQC